MIIKLVLYNDKEKFCEIIEIENKFQKTWSIFNINKLIYFLNHLKLHTPFYQLTHSKIMGNHPYTMYARRNKFKRKLNAIMVKIYSILQYNKFQVILKLYNVADSVVVITGASSGMGKEITYRYAERGCKIVIGSRNI